MSAPASPIKVWFFDTSSLLSMALHEDIEASVLDEIGADRVMIIDIIHDELNRRATISDTAVLAKTALNRFQPHWMVMDTGRFVSLEEIQLAQEDVADGRMLTDDRQHWAESTIIALARRSVTAGSRSIKMLLSEDFDAPSASPATSRPHAASAFMRSFTNASRAIA
jgi:hypothetical protein